MHTQGSKVEGKFGLKLNLAFDGVVVRGVSCCAESSWMYSIPVKHTREMRNLGSGSLFASLNPTARSLGPS